MAEHLHHAACPDFFCCPSDVETAKSGLGSAQDAREENSGSIKRHVGVLAVNKLFACNAQPGRALGIGPVRFLFVFDVRRPCAAGRVTAGLDDGGLPLLNALSGKFLQGARIDRARHTARDSLPPLLSCRQPTKYFQPTGKQAHPKRVSFRHQTSLFISSPDPRVGNEMWMCERGWAGVPRPPGGRGRLDQETARVWPSGWLLV